MRVLWSADVAQIKPDEKPDHDRRTFACMECQSDLVEVVKYR